MQDLSIIIDELRDEMIRTLKGWIQVPSVKAAPEPGAPFGREVRRALDLVLSDAAAMGFETRNFDGYAGDVRMGPLGVDPLAILVHLDVVPAGDGWSMDPFGAEIEGGRMYGRGMSDDKGPAAAALYAMQNGEAATVVHGDETLNSVAYRNDVLDYTLELPLSFRNTVGIRQYEDGSVHFNMLDEADSSSAHDICIMTLNVDATAVLHSEYGENWTKNYPSPVKQLAEKDGLTYYLAYVSDVQYDPSNQEIAAKYKEMFTAAQNITAEDFVLDDLTDQDGTVRRAQLLTSLGAHYAVLHMGAQHDQPYQVAVNTNNNSCEVYVSRIDWTTEAQYKVYAADRVTFKDITNTEPTTVEHLADSTQGLTAEQFDLLYGTLDLPVYTDDELANLQRVLQKDQIPEQGAAFFLGLGDMYGIFDGDSVKIYGDNNEFASLTYQFTDPNTGKENGKYVKLTMHKAIADSSLPALWIPYSYELFTA